MQSLSMELHQNSVLGLTAKGLKNWWWVLLAGLLAFFFYYYGVGKKRDATFRMQEKIQYLQKQRAEFLEEKESLETQIASQSDLDWIELALKRGLGLVPEGQKKIYFIKKHQKTSFFRERM